jgi:hypothetical protein
MGASLAFGRSTISIHWDANLRRLRSSFDQRLVSATVSGYDFGLVPNSSKPQIVHGLNVSRLH